MTKIEALQQWTLLLGSGSPRRQELIRKFEFPVKIVKAEYDERIDEPIANEEQPEYLALRKSRAFADPGEQECLITSDTSVLFQNDILNKPENRQEAIDMLEALNGAQHDVFTGVSLRTSSDQYSFTEVSRVFFDRMEREEIEFYVDQYTPFDKAGSYGIQEWFGYVAVRRIEGCFFNVMGLPLPRLYKELKSFLLTH